MKIVLRDGMEADAMAICRLRRKVWLSSYVRPDIGITRAKILSCYGFTDKDTLSYYRTLLSSAHGGGGGGTASHTASRIGFWVVEAHLLKGQKKLVGFASADRSDNCLTMLYVDPHYQRRGIGAMLLSSIKDFLDSEKDIVLTVVDFNANAQDFYLKRGFVFADDVDTPPLCVSLFGSKGMRLKATS